MRNVVVLIALVAALAGCQTKTVEEMSYSERKQLASVISKRCADQGYTDGNPEMPACIKQEVSREVATRRREAAREDAISASGGGGTTYCQGFGTNVVCF